MAYYSLNALTANKKQNSTYKSINSLIPSINADNTYSNQPSTSTNNGGILGGIGYLSEKLAVGFVSSLEGIVDYSAAGLAKLFGADDWAEDVIANDWFGDWYSHPDEWFQPSGGWKMAGDVASGIGTSLPAIGGVVAGVAIAGASGGTLSPLAAGLISASISGLGAAGTATKEAYQATGKLDGNAFGYGALTGLTEGAMEGVTNALTLGTGKIVKTIAGSLGKNFAKTAAKEVAETGLKATAKNLAGAFIGEAFEEGMSEVLSPYWKRMTYDPNAENASAEEIGYSFLVGGLSGLFMDGGRIAVGNTNSYIKGNNLARSGKSQEVLSLSEQISSFYDKNQTDNESFKVVSDTYKKLSQSLAATNGEVATVQQKKMLGDLQKANVSAVFTPIISKSAANIVSNADAIAAKLNSYGMKDANGKALSFTADDIRAGIDTKTTDAKKLSKSFTEALKKNAVLRALAVADATGHLMMDTAKFEQASLRGEQLASQADLNRFYETATPAEIRSVSEALGIDNWATLTPAAFHQKIQTFMENGGGARYAQSKQAAQAFEAIPAQSAQKMPSAVDLTADGAVRYTEGALSVAIEKKGNSYRIYDYGTGKLTKFVPAETVNGYLQNYRTQADSLMAQEAARQQELAEVEAFARENVSEYKNLNDANQSMIRKVIRNGRAAGISDADLATYAKVSAHAGIDIVFDKEATYEKGTGKYADGYYSASGNRIVVNPEGTRNAERLLLHELDHAIRQSHGVTAYRQALEGVSEEVRQNIVKSYSGVAEAENRTALVMDETNARYAEDILSNKHTLERLVQAEPPLKERILSFFKDASADYADAPKLSGAARKYYRTYKKLFDSFAEANYQGNAYGGTATGGTKYALWGDNYSYDVLTKKSDISVTTLPDEIPMTEDGKIDRKTIVTRGRLDARSQNNINNTEEKTFVYVADIDTDVLIRRDGLEHGLSRNDENTALATMRIGDLLKNSVAVNEMNGRTKGKRTTEMSYVLLAVGQNKNSPYLVRMIVDKATNSVSEISTYGLYAIKAKKEGALFMPKGNEAVSDESHLSPYLRSTISIAELLENVKSLSLANEIFSENVLKKLGVSRSEGTLSGDIRYALPDDDVSQSIRETEKKRNFGYTEGQEAKAEANENAKKVYTRKDASRIVSSVMAETMNFGEVYGNLVGGSREQVVEMLWKALNSAPAGERVGVALKIAEYTIDHAVVEDAVEDPNNEYYRDTVSVLHDYVRKLDLSGIRDEIRHKYDKQSAGVYSRWGAQKGTAGIPPDVVAMELAERGFPIDATHPADILFEMDAAYRKATQALKARGRTALKNGLTDAERKKLQGEIVSSILRGYDTEGSPSKLAKTINEYSERLRKLSGELREEKGRNSLINRALDSVGKLKDIKLGKQHNATEFNDPLFRGSIGKLANIKYRGNLRDAGTRKIFVEFAPWYHAENQLFADQKDLYQQSIADMISQIANGEGDLTNADLKALTNVVDYFRHLVENYNKVYRKGQWVDAEPIAKRYVNTLQSNTGIKTNLFGKVWGTWYGDLFADPISLARRMDYYESGFYSEMMEELRDAAVDAQVTEMEIMSSYDAFMKAHPKYLAEAQKQTVNYRARELPKMQAIGLYMTMKRKHAWAGIALSGFSYLNKKGDTVRITGITTDQKITQQELKRMITEQQQSLESQFTDADREYIAILEQVYNHDARKLKEERDLQRLGYSNVADDYYYPIRRGNISENVDTSNRWSELDRVSNASFNKDTVQGAKQELFVEDADAVFRHHVRAVCRYATLSPAIDNYNRLYSMDVSGNKNRPVSVATEGANTWKKGDLYFRKLISDIQGIRTGSGEGMAALAFIRSGYAKFQLGGNPKVWITQLSSLFAASGMLDTTSIMKGFVLPSKDVEAYCSLAKLRAYDNTVAKSQGLIDKTDKISDFFMKPIGAMDKFVVGRLFGACQVQVEKNGGAEVGTEQNKQAAGELLRQVILETQQNSLATERSKAMRSDNELLRTVTMFSADSMKVFGRVVDSLGKHYVLKQKLKATTDTDVRKNLEKQLKDATRQARKSVAALVTSAVFMVAIAEGFRWIYNKEREDEDVAKTVTLDLIGNMIGGLPILRDIYSKITDGYDLDNYAYSAANDLLNSTINLFDAVGTVFSGEADSQKIAASIKNSVNAAGQILGIPTRNLYNVTTGLIRRVSPTFAYKIDRVFYKKSYTADLAKAIEDGDGAMVATVMEIVLNENLGTFSDEVRTELNSLTMSGYNVIPRKVGDTVSVNGEEVALSEEQQAQIRASYATVDKELAALFASSRYQALSEENKTLAVKYLYDLYYETALLKSGIDRGGSAALLAKVVEGESLALLYINTKGMESDVDRRGNTIVGSKRKKIVAAINALGISAEQKLLLICAKGYSIQDGDVGLISSDHAKTRLLRYILRLRVSREEKAALAEMCGFEVKNGRIMMKKS